MNILGLSVLFIPHSEAFRIGINSLQRSKLFQLRMSDISWTQSKVVKNEKNAEGLRFIEMEIPESLIGSYTVPGQVDCNCKYIFNITNFILLFFHT